MTVTEKTVTEESAEQAPVQEPTSTPGNCEVSVSSDRTKVLLTADDPLAAVDLTIEKIKAALEDLELPQLPADDQLIATLEAGCTLGEAVTDLVLIQGQPKVPATDGTLQWTRDFFTEGWAIDKETGSIDFWEKIDNRNVKQGELLVSILDPVEGRPGVDIFGAPLNVEKPKTAKIRCGKGVHQDPVDGGTGVYSTRGGKVRFSDGTVTVDEVYAIKGNVSLETGNVHHNGTVMIDGDVLEGATIEALGDVEVKGMLEPCNIQAGGNLTVGGGIVGQKDCLIQVGGDIQARYIHQAVIRAEGDVMVVREIAHSDIQTRGKVDIYQGRIAGGYTVARKGILVAEAGAGGSSTTELVVGIDPTLKAKLKILHDRTRKMDMARNSIRQTVHDHELREDELTVAQRQLMTGLQRRAEALAESMREAETSARRITIESMEDAKLEVAIFKEVRSGTIIQLGDQKTRVRNSILKPRIAQRRGTRVRILPMGEGNMPEEE